MATYVIIGASSGIGLQLAKNLAASGHRVLGTYHSSRSYSGTDLVSYHELNVTDEAPVLDFIPEAIDGLVYCPGSISLKPFNRFKPADFLSDYNLQVVGAIKIIQALLTRLKAGNNPSIILFSSVAATVGMAYHTMVSTAKGAIEGLTVALAAELAPVVRVNCVAPSLTDTPMAGSLLNTDDKRVANAGRHPLKKIGVPDDIAAMVEFLLSEKAGWISGQVMHVDGGMSTLKM